MVLTLGRWLKSSDLVCTERMLRALEGKCLALHSLDIRALSTPMAIIVLRATHGRLHELEADIEVVYGIARHCSGLRILSMGWNPEGEPIYHLSHMLHVVSPTLELLKIDDLAFTRKTSSTYGSCVRTCRAFLWASPATTRSQRTLTFSAHTDHSCDALFFMGCHLRYARGLWHRATIFAVVWTGAFLPKNFWRR